MSQAEDFEKVATMYALKRPRCEIAAYVVFVNDHGELSLRGKDQTLGVFHFPRREALKLADFIQETFL